MTMVFTKQNITMNGVNLWVVAQTVFDLAKFTQDLRTLDVTKYFSVITQWYW